MAEKPIHISRHAQHQALDRDVTEEEIAETIMEGLWRPAEKGRLMASQTFPFGREHYGRYYALKDVVPIFVEEPDRIVVITVYTFFS